MLLIAMAHGTQQLQYDQIGQIFKVFDEKLSYQSSPNFSDFLGHFDNNIFFRKTAMGTLFDLCKNLVYFYYHIWSHWGRQWST